jgi:hypothetical protein
VENEQIRRMAAIMDVESDAVGVSMPEGGGMGNGGGAAPLPIGDIEAADSVEWQIQQAGSVDELERIVEAARLGEAKGADPPQLLDPDQRARDKRADHVEVQAPAAKRGRKSAFSDAQKEWIMSRHGSVHNTTSVGPMVVMKAIAEHGVMGGSLPSATTGEQVREAVRAEFR